MNDTAKEYLPANGNGTNGHTNGNGHDNGKIFGLSKLEDPMLSKVVPDARRKVCENTKIPESARMFFCWLTDTALTYGIYIRRGVVKFADSYLAKRFCVNKKTIQNWRAALLSTREIWCTEMKMQNSFPRIVYNVTCIVGTQMPLPWAVESNDGSLPEDSIFTSNRNRLANIKHDRSTGKFVCRAHGQASCPICRALKTPPRLPGVFAPADNTEKKQENEPIRNILPSTTAIDCHPPRQIVAAQNGNELPSSTANGCREERQMVAVANGNDLPLSTANGCREERKSIANKRETGDVSRSNQEVSFKRSTVFNASKRPGGTRKLNPEEAFMAQVIEVMEMWKPGHSKGELTGSGVWWRFAYRIDPNLILRVLAEVAVMVKEGTIKFNPGSTAVDLWARWGGGKVCKERAEKISKQKTAAGAAARV